jgi:hypothetical protein
VNEDGAVDMLDQAALVDHLLEVTLLSGTPLANADANQDGVVDIRDVVFISRFVLDTDMDGLPDDVELVLGLDPMSVDTDGNGTLDGDEDADGDGLTNREEVESGANPLLFDSDGDGFSDSDEVAASSDPSDAQDIPIFDARSSAVSFLFLDPQGGLPSTGVQVSAPVSFRFFDMQGSLASTGVQVSAPVSYRFLNAQGSLASTGVQVSAALSYSFFDGGTAGGSGMFVLSQGVSYSF